MSRVKVGEISIEYEEFGRKSDPAFILIMGLGLQMIHWDEILCEGLAKEGFRVIRFDNRDVGLSGKLEDKKSPNIFLMLLLKRFLGYTMKPPYTISDMANDVIGLMDALDIEKAHIAGASMGGLITQVLGLKHSNRLLSLTTIFAPTGNPKIKPPDADLVKLILTRPSEDRPFDEISEKIIYIYNLLSDKKYPLNSREKEKIKQGIKRCYYPKGMQRQAAAVIAEPVTSPRIRDMHLPLLILHGDKDRLVPVEHAYELSKNAPNAELVIFEGMGHFIPEELFPEFINYISRHAKKIQST